MGEGPTVTGRSVESRLALAVTLVVLGALAADDGGYPATAWGWGAVAVSGVLVGAALAGLLRRPGPLELAFLTAAGAFASWTWLSVVWSLDPAESVLEGERTLLYLAAAGALVLVLRRRTVPALLGGALAAIALACGYGLAARLFPGSLGESGVRTPDPQSAFRLAEPLGYSNALGLYAALGAILALGFALRAAHPAARLLSASSLPLMLGTLYFTFGRGAWIALGAGLAVALITDPHRLRLTVGGLALAPLSVAGVLLASRAEGLSRSGASHAEAVHDGRLLAFELVVLAVLSGAAAWPARALSLGVDARPGVRRALAVSVLGALALAVAGTLVLAGGPAALANRAYDAFAAPPPVLKGDQSRRLLSLSAHGRTEYWKVALEDAGDHPLVGSGGGSFQRYWLQHREQPLPVRDAHSLYLETLAELGPAGLGLLLLALALPVAAALRVRRHTLAAPALGAYAAYLIHAGVDWDWELPAVTLAALGCGAGLVVLARDRDSEASTRFRAWVGVVATVVAVVAGYGYVGNRAVAAANDAVDRSDYGAAEANARVARRWIFWSTEGWRLLGEAQLAQGDVEAARRSLRRGLERDDRDWELWLDLALASEGSARRNALDEAARLNPLAPELAQLRTSGA